MMSEFRKKVQEFQKSVVEQYKKLKEDAPQVDTKFIRDITNAQMSLLHKTGFRDLDKTKKKVSSKPDPNFFKKKTQTTLSDTPEPEKIENKGAPKDFFKKKDVEETIEAKSEKEIKNDAPPKDFFKKKDIVEGKPTKKSNPKRLNPQQMADIERLVKEKKTVAEISDTLNVVESKIKKTIESINKKNAKRNLLATNQPTKSFEDEVKESKKDN